MLKKKKKEEKKKYQSEYLEVLINLKSMAITEEEIASFKIKVGRNPDLKKVYTAYLKLQKKLLVKMKKLETEEEKNYYQKKIEELTFLLKELSQMIIAEHNHRYYTRKKAWLESIFSEEELQEVLQIYQQKEKLDKVPKKTKEPTRKRKRGKINRRG